MHTYAKQALAVEPETPHRLTLAALRSVDDTINKLIDTVGWSHADTETRDAIKDMRFALFTLRVKNAEAGGGSPREWRDVAMFCSLRVYRLSAPEAHLVRSVFELSRRGQSPPLEWQQWLCASDRLRARERQDESRDLLGRR
jgi:hypothetical protein